MISSIILTNLTDAAIIGIGVLSSVLLIIFLGSSEILSASTKEKHKILADTFIIGIVPLLISFIVIVTFKVIEILG